MLASRTALLFEGEEGRAFYYAGWSSQNRVVVRSPNVPVGLSVPDAQANGRTYERTRDHYREMYHFTERGDCVLAGTSVEPVVAASRRFGWILAGTGLFVLLVGMGGTWLIVDRSLRPLHEIGATVRRIAAGNLSERINVPDARSELGGLGQVLNSTFSRLEAAFADQKNFTADASHELRTPIAVMAMETERVLARERSASEYRASLTVCRDTTEDMRKLTESLLQLARLDAGQEGMKLKTCDMAAVAESACDLVRPVVVERPLRMSKNFKPAPMMADPDRIKQVVLNLLQNAIRYNKPNGEIHVSTAIESDQAVLRVTDTGVGIATADTTRVFERFYRADRARSRSEGSAGLGLAICKSIVDAHGGEIVIESTSPSGTTFAVRIPQ
ncbi:MAG: HAMP domain-containing protein [Opitutaceae bacterium]|nr:HAMP domain-containing protein [Opitutaceae bacterium]